MSKIFTVLGATGNVGHVIVEDLLKRGYNVRAVGRDPRKLHHLEIKGATPITLNCEDSEAMADAFRDCYAIFVMIPPGHGEADFEAFQDRVGEAIVKAIQKSNVKRVVNLSSVGGDLALGTGPIKGLHRQEERLNALTDLNLLVHLRPNYFMENLNLYLPMLPQDVIRTIMPGDLKIPMVATRDIGWKAVDFLDSSARQMRAIFDFCGPYDVCFNDVIALFREAFDHPNLQYKQFTVDEEKQCLLEFGMNAKTADLIIEMEKAFCDGRIKPTQEITRDHKGTTTLESFVQMIAHCTLAASRH